MLNVRLVRGGKGIKSAGGPVLGKVEESFLEMLSHGDTFFFAGEVLRFEGIRENECYVSKTHDEDAKIPAYAGGKFPLSTYLAASVRKMLSNPGDWTKLPDQVRDWLEIQREYSVLPTADDLLVETFPRDDRYFLAAYPV